MEAKAEIGFKEPYDWYDFCNFLLIENRHILNPRWRKFIDSILATAKKREEVLKINDLFVRVRIGIDEKKVKDAQGGRYRRPKDLGPPARGESPEGRLNSFGIPYFYLADTKDTAIAEIRPWPGAELSVGYFKLNKSKRLINLTNDPVGQLATLLIAKSLNSVDIEKAVWASINDIFSRPISPYEKSLYYVPTQYLSDVFRSEGYDGIKYKSSLHPDGFNLCMFANEDFLLEKTEMCVVSVVKYEHIELGTL